MPFNSDAFYKVSQSTEQTSDYFHEKLAYETDCSDVYSDIKSDQKNYILLDVRSTEAFQKSHAVTAVNIPNHEITVERFSQYDKNTLFVVYCWGPGCNGASKAAAKISSMGFIVKEMIGGIHYWEDFERYPVNRKMLTAQS